MTRFQDFNEEFFEGHNVAWEGRHGTLPLDNGLLATLELSIRAKPQATHGHYTGYVVRIVGREEIAQKQFAFDDYFTRADRVDDRIPGTDTKYPYPREATTRAHFEIIAYVKDDWYIAAPSRKATRRMADAVVNYIRQFEHIA